MSRYKKKINLFLFLIIIALLSINSPNVNAILQINILKFDTDKSYYNTDENINIEASWILNYNPIEEWAYVQIQLFDSFDQLMWCSEQNDTIGIFNKNWTIGILSLNLSFFEYSTNFSVIFYLFHMVGEEIFSSGPIATKSIQVFKKILSCSLFDYDEKLNYGEILCFQALFFNITNNKTNYPDNLLVTLKIYKQMELVYEEQYNTINGSIYINISTSTFPIIGELELKLITSNDIIYFNHIFTYSLKVQKLGLNYTLNEYNKNVKYNENVTINIRFFNCSNGQIRYIEILNISVRIFSNNILIYKNFYNSNKNGTLIILISSEIFEENGEKSIFIDIFNNLYYNDLSIKLTIFFHNNQNDDNQNDDNQNDDNQNENNLIFIFNNLILILLISIFSGAGTLFIFQRKRKINKNLFEITFKY